MSPKRITKIIQISKLISRKKVKFAFVFLAILLAFLILAAGAYSLAYSGKIYHNQFLGDIPLGGKNKQKTAEILKEKSDKILTGNIELKFLGQPEKDYSIIPADLGVKYDVVESAEEVWLTGRSGNFLHNIVIKIKSLFTKTKHRMAYSINEEVLSAKIKEIAKEVDEPEQDFSLSYSGGKFNLSSERKAGERINQAEVVNDIKNKFAFLETKNINFSPNHYEPQIDEEEAKDALTRANNILKYGEIILAYEAQEFKADPDTLGGFIKSEPNGNDLEVVFNDERLKLFVENLAKSIDVDPVNAKLTITGGKASVFQTATTGKKLDKTQTKADIENVINSRMTSSEPEANLKKIALKVAVKEPEITESKINNLGIAELIGTAFTNFKGSPQNRVHNINVGAAALNGALVKPGETFSTIQKLGAIDASGGYLEELVIKENKTTPEFGGGLCQVSSTLFRATLNAGLKIIERQNHKYRVSYYEPPVGMDATIYDPSPDFKFQNNYGSYLLIQSRVEGTKITFDIYGTKDGRSVEISNPVVGDFVDPGPPIFTETETMPPGEKKIVEKPHQGATARFHYKVVRGSEVLQERDFVSKYVPWAEKWLVGKGTPAPAPQPAPAPTPEPAPQPTPAPSSSCTDGIQNGDETGIDCGGTCPTACPT